MTDETRPPAAPVAGDVDALTDRAIAAGALPRQPSRWRPALHLMGVSAGALSMPAWAGGADWRLVAVAAALTAWSLALHVYGRTLDVRAIVDGLARILGRR